AHDVVPVQMGHEGVKSLTGGPTSREHLVAEDPGARAQVAEDVVALAGDDLHARRVATERVRAGEVDLAVEEGRRLLRRLEAAPGRARERRDQLAPDLGRGHGDRDGAAGSPELDLQTLVRRHRTPSVPWARAGPTPR